MRELTMDQQERRFAHRVDVAIKALGENEINKAKDICSVDFLRETINGARNKQIHYIDEGLWVRDAETDVKGLDQVMDVVLWMCSKHLQWAEDRGLGVAPIQLEEKKSCRFQELYSQLKDIILFVDESLPEGESSEDGQPDEDAIDRLRFVRNLARGLKMKVVLAGTAATAANMIALKSTRKKQSSRIDLAGDMAWIECQFLWKTMSKDDVKEVVLSKLAQPNVLDQAVISALAQGRPYLVHLFGQVTNRQHINSEKLHEVLEKVGEVLEKVKDLSDKTKVVHLTGAWLQQMHISPCGFYVKTADLVRGSYFEPCVVLDMDRDPACGLRMGERSLAPGPLRVKIYRERSNKDIMWCAAIEDETSEEQREGYCSDFSGIEYSLSACVQQCLAREPLLAVALSTICWMEKATFRNALSALYKQGVQQLAANKADGELNEQILFAVLQLASNSQNLSGPRVKLDTFLRMITDYLTNESLAQRVEAFRGDLDKYLKPGPSRKRSTTSGTPNKEFEIDKLANDYTMPWLVPACSLEALEGTSRRASRLFAGSNIAGLVPRDQNAAFDAEAYPWENLPVDDESTDVSQPGWVFEFKIRAKNYSVARAFKDLNDKCWSRGRGTQSASDDQLDKLQSQKPKKKKGRRASALDQPDEQDKPDKLQCHAILIAVTGARNNCCDIVHHKIGSEKYLRVVLVVGLGRKQWK